jgi:hypothetical protein
MKKTKGIQLLLTIVISLFFLVFLAYLRYGSLTGTDFLSSTLSYQNLDEGSLSVDSLNKLKIYTLSFTHFVFLPGTNFITQILHFFPQTSFLQQRTSVLRF